MTHIWRYFLGNRLGSYFVPEKTSEMSPQVRMPIVSTAFAMLFPTHVLDSKIMLHVSFCIFRDVLCPRSSTREARRYFDVSTWGICPSARVSCTRPLPQTKDFLKSLSPSPRNSSKNVDVASGQLPEEKQGNTPGRIRTNQETFFFLVFHSYRLFFFSCEWDGDNK